MTRIQHLLVILEEECLEVAHRASKALRFSLDEVQPGQEYTNHQRIMHEYADVVGVLDMLGNEVGTMIPEDFEKRTSSKRKKVEEFLVLSKSLGTLDDEAEVTA